MKRTVVTALWVCGLVAAGAAPASAQSSMDAFRGYFTGQLGWTRGADVAEPVVTPGLAIAVQESNGWGAEFDFGYAAEATSGRQLLDLATYMVNGSWVQPRGRVRPFVSAGAGVIQADGCDAPCARPARTYDLGLNAGGGAFFTLNDLIAVRGDVRYFRTLADHPDLGRVSKLSFWRASVGVTLQWVIVP